MRQGAAGPAVSHHQVRAGQTHALGDGDRRRGDRRELAGLVYDRIQLAAYIESHFFVRTLIPVVVLLACVYLMFWLVGRQRGVVDFMIATEGEMKKVNWSAARESGATRVVIVTVLALAFLLFVVDIVLHVRVHAPSAC